MALCGSCGSELVGSARFCPSCGNPVEAKSSIAQDASLTANVSSPKPKTRRVGPILFPIVLVFGLGFFYLYVNPSVHKIIQEQPVVSEPADYGPEFVTMTTVPFRDEGDDLVFSLADLKRHRLVRFEHRGGKTPRVVMAYVAPDGRAVTAISVSEHCGSKEFKIKDNKIYCSRCASNWDIMTMEAYACCAPYYPDPIPSKVVGDEVHISKEVVEKWAGRL